MSILDRFNLTGRSAIVTGASRGIGKAIALGLAECGANVLVHYAGNSALAQDVANQCRKFNVQATTCGANLTHPDAPKRILAAATQAFAHIDILVLNASIQVRKDYPDITREDCDSQLLVNFRSSFELMQLALPAMIARHWGRILTIGSVQQSKPHFQMPIYAASKLALLSLVRNLAKSVAQDGVRINNLAPGVIDTDRNSAPLSNPEYLKRVLDSIPTRTIGTPEDCVPTALLLCSDAAAYITGADYYVDGGMQL